VRHEWTININSSIPNTHLYIPQTTIYESGDRQQYTPLTISGDTTTPSNIKVASVSGRGIQGHALVVEGIALQEEDPFSNEGVGFFMRASVGYLRDSIFEGGTYGCLAYGPDAFIKLKRVDFGSSVLSDSANLTKHNGTITEQKGVATPTEGNVGGYAYDVGEGMIRFRGSSSTLSGSAGLVDFHDGFVLDTEQGVLYGAEEIQLGNDTWIESDEPNDRFVFVAGGKNDVKVFTQTAAGANTRRLVITGGVDDAELQLVNTRINLQSFYNTTADSMTANPEADSEDGYIEIEVAGTVYQVPIYSP